MWQQGAPLELASLRPAHGPRLSSDRDNRTTRRVRYRLSRVCPPAGNYLGCVVQDDTVYAGGHGPIDGERLVRGKVGTDLTLDEAREAARLTALSILATLRAELGDLDRILRIVKVFGMGNAATGFNQTPAVIDGSSDLLVEVFGEAGRHTRSAVGLAELPFDIAVEIELIARLRTG